MANIQQRLARYSGHGSEIAQSAEKAGLGPRTEGAKQHAVKAGRLKGQLFAYTVTNQGAFIVHFTTPEVCESKRKEGGGLRCSLRLCGRRPKK